MNEGDLLEIAYRDIDLLYQRIRLYRAALYEACGNDMSKIIELIERHGLRLEEVKLRREEI